MPPDPVLQGLPPPPDKPHSLECCNRGCCPCIFDYYWDALARWQASIRALGGDPERVLQALAEAAALAPL